MVIDLGVIFGVATVIATLVLLVASAETWKRRLGWSALIVAAPAILLLWDVVGRVAMMAINIALLLVMQTARAVLEVLVRL